MIQPLRYLLSFFREEVLEVSSSPYNPHLEVWYAWGKVMINAAHVNYSFGELGTVFEEAFRKLNVLDGKRTKVLLLGLGAGNVPRILQKRPGKFMVTGVEIDPEMVRLACKYCQMDQISGLEIVVADAVSFVSQCRSTFDMVIVDLFVDAEVPTAAEQPSFLLQCKDLLAADGILLFNRLMHLPPLRERSEAFTRTMMEVLPGTRFISAHTNRMLIYEK